MFYQGLVLFQRKKRIKWEKIVIFANHRWLKCFLRCRLHLDHIKQLLMNVFSMNGPILVLNEFIPFTSIRVSNG